MTAITKGSLLWKLFVDKDITKKCWLNRPQAADVLQALHSANILAAFKGTRICAADLTHVLCIWRMYSYS